MSSPTFLPLPDSLGCLQTRAGSSHGWHTHPFDELCLVEGTATTIGHAGEQTTAATETLYLFRRGERHGYWNAKRQSPVLWVIHYHGHDGLDSALTFAGSVPDQRIWRLSREQAETFKALHLKISLERSLGRTGGEAAQSAWLQLLLVSVARWSMNTSADITPRLVDSDLQQLWQILHRYAGGPAGLVAELKRQFPNYDSLRHRFKAAIGDSPTRLWSRLRMHQARNLLLESPLSVKEIAVKAGYARQHEFGRAFRKQFGVSPTEWRRGSSLFPQASGPRRGPGTGRATRS